MGNATNKYMTEDEQKICLEKLAYLSVAIKLSDKR